MAERFEKPWRIEELDGAWKVLSANDVPLGYFYWSTGPTDTMRRPSKEQALVLAKAFARIGQ